MTIRFRLPPKPVKAEPEGVELTTDEIHKQIAALVGANPSTPGHYVRPGTRFKLPPPRVALPPRSAPPGQFSLHGPGPYLRDAVLPEPPVEDWVRWLQDGDIKLDYLHRGQLVGVAHALGYEVGETRGVGIVGLRKLVTARIHSS